MRKAKIVKVIEDYPFVMVFYKSGAYREYRSFWDAPQTVKDFILESNKTRRLNDSAKEYL